MTQAMLAGRTAIVTGGARGLGRVMALALTRAGANVFIIARSADQIAQTVAEAQALGRGQCAGASFDVAQPADCQAAVAEAERQFGPVDILVNNAAVGLSASNTGGSVNQVRPFWTVDPDGVAQMVSVNLLGAFWMFQAVAPGMVERGFGRVVNISTSRPTMRRPNSGPYGPIKAALEAATHIWAQELAGTGVTANALLPGGISDTALVPGDNVGQRAKPFAAGKGELGLEGRSMELLPADIMGPPILWLASDDSQGFTGRRFVARDWDPDLPQSEAALRAMQASSEAPIIM